MNKSDIYKFLKENNIWHVITEHEPVYNMEESSKLNLPYPEAEAKNLFLRDSKKKNYYLITLKGDKKVDLQKFKEKHNTKSLGFSSSEDLYKILKLTPGSVTPFGLLNNEDCSVNFFIDESFLQGEGIINVHPNDNTATLSIKTSDLIDIIKTHGNNVVVTSFY